MNISQNNVPSPLKILHPDKGLIKGGGEVVGGFTDQIWSTYGNYLQSDKGFLFNLSRDVKYELTGKEFAILGTKDCGPVFGEGADLYIADECQQNSLSFTNFGVSYKSRPNEIPQGKRHMQVKEIEVFSVC